MVRSECRGYSLSQLRLSTTSLTSSTGICSHAEHSLTLLDSENDSVATLLTFSACFLPTQHPNILKTLGQHSRKSLFIVTFTPTFDAISPLILVYIQYKKSGKNYHENMQELPSFLLITRTKKAPDQGAYEHQRYKFTNHFLILLIICTLH